VSAPKLLAAALLVVLPSVGLAANGVLEINHTCATLAGCFPGDTAGYPVTIASLGSYRLTSNLVVPDVDTDGILVQADDVAIDLAGFAIVRADCVPAAAACARTFGGGIGIFAEALMLGRYRGTTVRNGTIVGMGSFSLLLGDRANVANLALRRNSRGVFVLRGSTVQRCVVEDSGSIAAGSGSLLTENVVSGANGSGVPAANGSGLIVGGGSVISRNSVSQNGLHGILQGTGGSVYFGNTSYQNDSSGFGGALYSTLADNTTYGNGTDALPTFRSGIQARRSLVVGNTMTDNVQYGLESDGAAYRENVINGNPVGTVTGVAIDLGGNSCNGTSTCP
jgi:hypothetical protein